MIDDAVTATKVNVANGIHAVEMETVMKMVVIDVEKKIPTGEMTNQIAVAEEVRNPAVLILNLVMDEEYRDIRVPQSTTAAETIRCECMMFLETQCNLFTCIFHLRLEEVLEAGIRPL